MAAAVEDDLNLLTVAEVATVLGAQEEVVRQWVRSGRLSGFKLGDGPKARYRIPSHAVAAFLRDARAEAVERR